MAGKKTAAVLACAGSGSRMGSSCRDKLLLDQSGIPVAARALRAFDRTEGIDYLVVVTQEPLIPLYRTFREKYGIEKELLVTAGGATRMESVYKGVSAVPEDFEFVAIGDGARPLIRPQEIRAVLEAAWVSGAAALGTRLTDTVKEVREGRIVRTVPREYLVGIQTPQAFRRRTYLELAAAAAKTRETFTDDAAIYEYFDRPVSFVEGRRDNLKITLPEDAALILALLEE